ncbi:MAG: hypothetical protein PVG70_00855 [Desulfobacterales bacterium]|jgi:hypothetical protein
MISESEIRRFTDKGLDDFRNYLADLRAGSPSPPPFHLLRNPDTSESFNSSRQVKQRIFSTRLVLARYLEDILSGIETDGIETDVHLWSWLSLFYFDQVCPAAENGIRRPGRDYRHILEPGYPYGHNHLIFGAFLVHSVYGLGNELCRLLLYTSPNIESGYHHQLAQRQSIVTNRGIMAAAATLYFDYKKNKPKFGAIPKNKPGTLYRFIDVIQQLDLNYDLYSMSRDEILDLLPQEFNKWKDYRPL